MSTVMYEIQDDDRNRRFDYGRICVGCIVWALLGVSAFIWSIMCFDKKGTVGQKTVGLLLSFFFGPLYWVYYATKKGYCRVPDDMTT
jgi:hypothetical protein